VTIAPGIFDTHSSPNCRSMRRSLGERFLSHQGSVAGEFAALVPCHRE
jgi:hypothetical protein